MSGFPWSGPGYKRQGARFTRADPGHPGDIYWGLDEQDMPLLLLGNIPSRSVPDSLPAIFEMEITSIDKGDAVDIHIGLRSLELEDVFHRLCTDLIESSRGVADPADRSARILTRLVNWMSLLARGGSGGLTQEQIRGLFCELVFLRHAVAEGGLGWREAIHGWFGPLREAKDFELCGLGIEIKCLTQRDQESLLISSEAQLDSAGSPLYLVVYSLIEAETGQSLAELVASTRSGVREAAPAELEALDDRLHSAGYVPHARYEQQQFAVTLVRSFDVAADFPKLTPATMPPQIHKVRYRIRTGALGAWLIDPIEIDRMLREASDA